MKTSGNVVLITGGSAGIGYALAKRLTASNNQVLITGRNKDRLEKAAASLNNCTGIQADITNAEDIEKLVNNIYANYPALNVVINNAGVSMSSDLLTTSGIFEKAAAEMLTNYLSVIRLNDKLLQLLLKQPEASIVNVSSRVAIVPRIDALTYSASKAALHSYTLALRLVLEKTTVKVFELMPPLVNTAFTAASGGEKGMLPDQVAALFADAFEKNNFEIHVAGTAVLYQLYLSSPSDALKAVNNIY